jgi:hypothetical protein
VFTLYFDDSGTHRESEIAVAACLIAPDVKWESIHARWNDVILREGLDKSRAGCFHMATCVSGKQPPYDSWSGDKKRSIYREFLALMAEAAELGFSSYVSKAAHERFIANRHSTLVGALPYTYTVRACIGSTRKFREQHEGPFAFVFDQLSEGTGEILNILGELPPEGKAGLTLPTSFEAWIQANKRKFPPLQAADIFAWNVYRIATDRDHPATDWCRMLNEYLPYLQIAPISEKHLLENARALENI